MTSGRTIVLRVAICMRRIDLATRTERIAHEFALLHRQKIGGDSEQKV
jgi:hypothetical protein